MKHPFIPQPSGIFRSAYLAASICLSGLVACAGGNNGKDTIIHASRTTGAEPRVDTSIKLPSGFRAVVFAEDMGRPRHIVVASNGTVYVKLAKLKDGKGIFKLEDTNGDGVADKMSGFGNYRGTGIAIHNGYLYAASDNDIYRYKLDANNNVTNPESPEKIVSGLIAKNEHNTKSIVLDNDGNLYTMVGAYSNSCQVQDRATGSMGMMPCKILDSAGGVWQFKADKQGQTYGDGVRYATGIRNVVGMDWNAATNSLFIMQHGRDQLNSIFPNMYTAKQNAELPAECMYELHKGDDCGWPYTYYDGFQKKKILAPEYGGDGKKTGGDKALDPVAAYPAHLAPNGLLFYTGNQFPEKYKNGAFIAFHGSWNRAPEPQMGFFVVFQPFRDGKPSGDWEVFADNFSGGAAQTASGRANHRPCGLAQGPDGSIYVTDDSKGTIWKITYKR